MDTRSLSTADVSPEIPPVARSTSYSISLNGNANFKEMDMSMTVEVDAEATPTNEESNIAENSCDVTTQFADISMNESGVDADAVVDLEAEEALEENITENDIDIEDSVIATTALEITDYVDERDYFQSALIELGRRLWKSSKEKQRYTKGGLWSPDGTCILVPVHLDGMHVLELPQDLYKLYTEEVALTERNVSKLETAVHVKEGGTVYDYAWYPFMNSTTPATCCWLASRQHEPIHMWDAFTGELRCTYRGYDSVDEVESAIAITFSLDGEKVIGGYKKSIKLFDTNIPGRDTSTIPVKQAVSCFAFTTDNDSTVTTGSWNGFINHYDLRAPKLGPLFTLGGHTGGITWLRYAALPVSDNWTLFSGARRDNKILEWDMRNYLEPVRTHTRTVATNQRIYFDLSPREQRWLVSGDTEGKLRIYDLQNNVEEAVPLHDDCCNGVNFHPSLPILATTSGQHHCVNTSEAEDSPKMKNAAQNEDEEIVVNYENSLMLWWIGKSAANEELKC